MKTIKRDQRKSQKGTQDPRKPRQYIQIGGEKKDFMGRARGGVDGEFRFGLKGGRHV